MKKYSREIDRALRALDRDICRLRVDESRAMAQVRAYTARARDEEARLYARQVARLRVQQRRCITVRIEMTTAQSQIQSARDTTMMVGVMRKLTRTMTDATCKVSLGELQSITQEFRKQTALMAEQQEQIDETMLEANDEGEEETQEDVEDRILAEVADQRGMQINERLPAAARRRTTASTTIDPLADRRRRGATGVVAKAPPVSATTTTNAADDNNDEDDAGNAKNNNAASSVILDKDLHLRLDRLAVHP